MASNVPLKHVFQFAPGMMGLLSSCKIFKAQKYSACGASVEGMQMTSDGSKSGAESMTAAMSTPPAGAAAAGKPTMGTDLRRIIKEVSKEARKSRVPLYIAVLAACLALVSMAEGDAKERALGAQIEASNKFAYFQAKNIRKTDSEIAADMLESIGKPELAATWRAKAARYQKEKAEILDGARAEQAKRAHGLKQSAYFSIAIALLQIAIVLATASLILGGGMLLWASAFVAVISVFFIFNGYYLYLEFPTDPVEFGKWLTTSVGGIEWLKGQI